MLSNRYLILDVQKSHEKHIITSLTISPRKLPARNNSLSQIANPTQPNTTLINSHNQKAQQYPISESWVL